MRSLLVICVVLGMGSGLSAEAVAPREACKADVEKFCGEVQPAGGAVLKCLRDRKEQLSESCREALAGARVAAEKGASACRIDVERFCKEVKPGEGRILACLKAHEAELSASCKEHAAAAKAQGRPRKEGR